MGVSPVRAFLTAIVYVTSVGGAWAASSLPPTYSLPAKYRQYSCGQLFNEGRLVSAQAVALSGEKKGSSAGGSAVNPESVVKVPAVLQSSKQTNGTLIELKQQLDAIETAAIESECQIEFVPQR
jgi:hypothetical protein